MFRMSLSEKYVRRSRNGFQISIYFIAKIPQSCLLMAKKHDKDVKDNNYSNKNRKISYII
jgi:hypothetical protein